jgi:squalene synthase HpnC
VGTVQDEATSGEPVAHAEPADDVLRAVAARSAAQISAENFPVALRLLPRRPRAALTAVYAFARFVDDVGDEAPGNRLALLDDVAADVRTAWAGGAPALAPVAGLQLWIEAAGLRPDPFLDLVEANRVDQRRSEYATFAELIDYCHLSAAPVGRIVLRIAGADTAENVADSDAVCNGLQVLEHCQDVGEDAGRGRVYLPQDDLAAAGVTVDDLRATSTSSALRRVVAREVQRADELLAAGPALVHRLSGWARLAVAGYVAGGEATADALRSADFDVLSRTVKPGKARTAGYLAKHWAGR